MDICILVMNLIDTENEFLLAVCGEQKFINCLGILNFFILINNDLSIK